MIKSKKAQVAIYLSFIIYAIIIIMIAAFAIPMGIDFNTKMYTEAEKIMLDANNTANLIQDTNVKSGIQDTIGKALDAQENNIDVNANIFRYSWIFVIGIVGIGLFLYTRRLVEFGQGGLI